MSPLNSTNTYQGPGAWEGSRAAGGPLPLQDVQVEKWWEWWDGTVYSTARFGI